MFQKLHQAFRSKESLWFLPQRWTVSLGVPGSAWIRTIIQVRADPVNSLDNQLHIQVHTSVRYTRQPATVCRSQTANSRGEYRSNVRNSSPSLVSTTSTATSTVSLMCVCKHCGSSRACVPRFNFYWKHPKIHAVAPSSNPWSARLLIFTVLRLLRAGISGASTPS